MIQDYSNVEGADMRSHRLRNWVSGAALAVFSSMAPQVAKAYPVDCAILLCLAGGWPASAECAHARAVFIRRITPWPVEPPLQIWRCPMGVSDRAPLQSVPPTIWQASSLPGLDISGLIRVNAESGSADIDISGIEFDFVRSIRVWDVRHYSHRERGEDGDCEERFSMRLGTYGAQGDFAWRSTTPSAAPTWVLPSRSCSWGSARRGVGVEWEDHEGNHGFEWVSY